MNSDTALIMALCILAIVIICVWRFNKKEGERIARRRKPHEASPPSHPSSMSDNDDRRRAQRLMGMRGFHSGSMIVESDSRIVRCEDEPELDTYGAWVDVSIWVDGAPRKSTRTTNETLS